jgi:Cu/Ag efflux pump CusA
MLGDLSGDPSPVEAQLFGPEYSMLEQAAAVAAKTLEKIPGMVDVFDGVERLETAIAGTVVGQVVERDRAIPLRLHYAGDIRNTLDMTRKLVLVGSDGNLAPLAAIARFETGIPTARREREGLRRVVGVTGRLEDGELGSANREARKEISRTVHLPPGVSARYGGLDASQQRAFRELARVLALDWPPSEESSWWSSDPSRRCWRSSCRARLP